MVARIAGSELAPCDQSGAPIVSFVGASSQLRSEAPCRALPPASLIASLGEGLAVLRHHKLPPASLIASLIASLGERLAVLRHHKLGGC